MASRSTTATTTQDHLRDYTIRLSGAPSRTSIDESSPSQPAASTAPGTSQNPPGWDTEHRQVPPYRPVNTSLDRESRPWGSNRVEDVIIFTMMHGVWLRGSISWLWRKTGGRLNEGAFTTTIGGES